MCPHCGDAACYRDRHHEYWPRRDYKRPLERKFRGMFIKRMWRCQHNELHATTAPPPKPSRKYMQQVVATRRAAA
jgi:hypothetical protein